MNHLVEDKIDIKSLLKTNSFMYLQKILCKIFLKLFKNKIHDLNYRIVPKFEF